MAEGISIVTTTWNERENIAKLIERVHQTLNDKVHEVIVVDDSSTDGTLEIAKQYADVAIKKEREGQTKGLLYGMKIAKYSIIVTIDSDLENSPELIPSLVDKMANKDLVVATRNTLPRWSERWAAKTLGRISGITDFYSNFRAYKKETITNLRLSGGETFGGELLIRAKKRGYTIGEMVYTPPPRRKKPRIGGNIRANARISIASLKCLIIYLF